MPPHCTRMRGRLLLLLFDALERIEIVGEPQHLSVSKLCSYELKHLEVAERKGDRYMPGDLGNTPAVMRRSDEFTSDRILIPDVGTDGLPRTERFYRDCDQGDFLEPM